MRPISFDPSPLRPPPSPLHSFSLMLLPPPPTSTPTPSSFPLQEGVLGNRHGKGGGEKGVGGGGDEINGGSKGWDSWYSFSHKVCNISILRSLLMVCLLLLFLFCFLFALGFGCCCCCRRFLGGLLLFSFFFRLFGCRCFLFFCFVFFFVFFFLSLLLLLFRFCFSFLGWLVFCLFCFLFLFVACVYVCVCVVCVWGGGVVVVGVQGRGGEGGPYRVQCGCGHVNRLQFNVSQILSLWMGQWNWLVHEQNSPLLSSCYYHYLHFTGHNCQEMAIRQNDRLSTWSTPSGRRRFVRNFNSFTAILAAPSLWNRPIKSGQIWNHWGLCSPSHECMKRFLSKSIKYTVCRRVCVPQFSARKSYKLRQ